MAKVIASATPAWARGPKSRPAFKGYGPLVADPNGLLNLPRGFSYRALSREGDTLTGGGIVPAAHDDMAAFSAGPWGTFLVRNHEVGATFSPDGDTLFANIQGEPSVTFAITGPWRRHQHG